MTCMQPRIAAYYDDESLKLLQRAFEGACWSIGLSARSSARDPEHVRSARDALAKAILSSAGRGSCDVQAVKAEALRAVLARRSATPPDRAELGAVRERLLGR